MVTPTKAIDLLFEGNERYIKSETMHPSRSDERKDAIKEKNPIAAIFTCSDLKVAPEVMFDQGYGELYVIRNAGNVMGPIEMESLLFAAVSLETPVILMLGHKNCKAIQAVVDGTCDEFVSIGKVLRGALESAKSKDPQELTKMAGSLNALRMAEIVSSHPKMRDLINQNKLIIKAAFFDPHSGKVELL